MQVAFITPFLSAEEKAFFVPLLDSRVQVRFASSPGGHIGAPPRPGAGALVVDAHLEELVREAEVLVSARWAPELLSAAKRARVALVPFVGISEQDRELLASWTHLTVCNSHYNAPFVAEHAFALLLAVAKRLLRFDQALRNGHWDGGAEDSTSVVLRGKTLGIIGYGAIGRHVAEMGRGFGMSVQAIRSKPHPGSSPGLAFLGGRQDLERVLTEADFLVVSVPLTAETRGMIGERELRLLKPSAILVNIARGPVIDEEALYRSLAERRVMGAGIDVWYQYPPPGERGAPSKFPFDTLSNVLLSPHRAADVVNRTREQLRSIAADLNWLGEGKPPRNVVIQGAAPSEFSK